MKIFLSKPHMSGNEQKNVKDAFDSNYIAPLGPHLDSFEEEVSKYIGNNLHCVGLSSGTAALHLALIVAGVEKGDEVWVSSMTFAGGVFPINYIGAKPRFFDLNPKPSPDIFNLVVKKLEADIDDIFIMEDSKVGLKSAIATNCKNVIYADRKSLDFDLNFRYRFTDLTDVLDLF